MDSYEIQRLTCAPMQSSDQDPDSPLTEPVATAAYTDEQWRHWSDCTDVQANLCLALSAYDTRPIFACDTHPQNETKPTVQGGKNNLYCHRSNTDLTKMENCAF